MRTGDPAGGDGAEYVAVRRIVAGGASCCCHHEPAGNSAAERRGAVWLAEIGAGAPAFITAGEAARTVTLREKSPDRLTGTVECRTGHCRQCAFTGTLHSIA